MRYTSTIVRMLRNDPLYEALKGQKQDEDAIDGTLGIARTDKQV